MPIAKLSTSGALDVMRSDEGNDSLDTLFRQNMGKEPLLSFSRPGDSPVQWIQLLHALDQQDLPGWPLLTPLKVQMQKCEKCSREFCSPINYRRHIRVHRRSLNSDKESHRNRDFLGAFWDKLSLEEAKEVVSFDDVMLKEVTGSSVVKALVSSIRKPAVWTLPQVYVKAGSTMLEIIQAKPSRLPISSQELFSVLDDASERTFLCTGTDESVQKYIFDGEAAKIGLELKNLVACASFLFEQKLLRAWLADKDAEALRCQKLLVEEEEAAQKRQAQLLERKKQKKLRQKEQKAKEQSNGGKAEGTVADSSEEPVLAEASSPSSLSDSVSSLPDVVADVTSCFIPVQFANEDDIDIEAQYYAGDEHFDSGNVQNADVQAVSATDRLHYRWQVAKSQRVGRNGFHGNQNSQVLKLDHIQKHASQKDRSFGSKVWTKKFKERRDDLSGPRSEKEATNGTNGKNCELMIGSISVPVRKSAAQQQDISIEEQDGHAMKHAMLNKNNVPEKLIKLEINQSGASRGSAKLWRPVSRQETRDLFAVQRASENSDACVVSDKVDNQIMPSDSDQLSCGMDVEDCWNITGVHELSEGNADAEALPFSSTAAKAFLAQRWKEAVASDHVTLVLSQELEPPEVPGSQNDCPKTNSAPDLQEQNIVGDGEVRLAKDGALGLAASGNPKAKSRMRPERSVKIKYVRKDRAVA